MENELQQYNTETLKPLFDAGKTLVLSIEEKSRVRGALEDAMHPRPLYTRKVVSPFYIRIEKYSFAIAVFLFIIAGGMSVGAQNTLPGDILYPIKIDFNERLSSLFSFGTKAIAVADLAHADARLVEVEQLSLQNKLTVSTQLFAQTQFIAEAQKVSDAITTLKAEGDVSGAADVSSNFETTLATHRDVLATLSATETATTSKQFLADLADTVDTHLSSTTEVRIADERAVATSTNTAVVTTLAHTAMKSAQDAVDHVTTLINDPNHVIDASIKAVTLTQVASATEDVASGTIQLSAGHAGGAFVLFKKADRTAQKAQLIINSENQIKSAIPTFIKISAGDTDDATTTTPIATTTVNVSTSTQTTTE